MIKPRSKKAIKKIKLNFHEDESKYEDKPLFTPKRPYQYKYTYRVVDSSLPLAQRVGTKLTYIKEDTFNFLGDIVFMRKNALMYKTAAFIKRNWLVFLGICGRVEYQTLKLWKAISHGVAHMAHGMKEIGKDGFWLGRKRVQGFNNKYEDVSYMRKTRVR